MHIHSKVLSADAHVIYRKGWFFFVSVYKWGVYENSQFIIDMQLVALVMVMLLQLSC